MVPVWDVPKASACISTGREETSRGYSMCLLLEGDITAAWLSIHGEGPSQSLMIVLLVATSEALGTIAGELKQAVSQRSISQRLA